MSPPHGRLVGLIGWPVDHSPSPAMHNAAFASVGLDWEYVLVPAEPGRIDEAVEELRARPFSGANVTVPHKRETIRLLDGLSGAARSIGAVNTIRVTPAGSLMGDNTDAAGFLADLHDAGVDPAAMDAVVIGAGGSARAVAHGLASSSARSIAILNRTVSSAEELASRLGERFEGIAVETGSFPADLDRLRDADLVVNCTPMGTEGFDADVEYDDLALRQGQVIYDLVYAPGRTPLLERAHACGATALGGLGMLVHQGALSFEIWTGLRAPLDVMRRAAHNGLQETSCRRG